MARIGGIIKRATGVLFPGVVLVRGRSSTGGVALTFDDGPHPENTPRLLDVLDAAQATATFFVQGKAAEQYPALLRAMDTRGHRIGNHGYAHLDARASRLGAYVGDVQRAQHVLEDILGRRTGKLFRPPYGNITAPSFLALARRGFRFVFWSVDSRDSFIREAPALVAHIESLPITGGDILLFHEDYAHTLESLPRILQSLKKRSLAFTCIGKR